MQELEFTPTGEFIELHQLLKVSGPCATAAAQARHWSPPGR